MSDGRRKSQFRGNKRGTTGGPAREERGDAEPVGEEVGGSTDGMAEGNGGFESDVEARRVETGTGSSSAARIETEPGAGESGAESASRAGGEPLAQEVTDRRPLDEGREPGKTKKGKEPKEEPGKKYYGFSGLAQETVEQLFAGIALVAGEHWALDTFEAKELTKAIREIPTPKKSGRLIKWLEEFHPFIGLAITMAIILKPRVEQSYDEYRFEKAKKVNDYYGHGYQQPGQPGQPGQPQPPPANANGHAGAAAAAAASAAAAGNPGAYGPSQQHDQESFNPALRLF